MTHTETTSTQLETPTDHGGYAQAGAKDQDAGDEDEDDDFTVDSPTQITGVQATPKLPSTSKKNTTERAALSKSTAAFRSPSPRKYTGKNPLALDEEPSTPRPQQQTVGGNMQSSPFEPESAFQPSAQPPRPNNDPLMHRVLDKNYRIQATPHTQRRQRQQATASKPTPATATKRALWDDSPQSSPDIAAPQLRSDLFSPAKAGPRTPGVSVLTPAARRTGTAMPTTSTGRQLFSPQDKTYTHTTQQYRTAHIFSDDEDEDDDLGEMSPPKTLQFHVPQSRLMQTPAREASKKIVEDLLLTAGAEATDEIEGIDDMSLVDEPSPSVVRRAWEEDTF